MEYFSQEIQRSLSMLVVGLTGSLKTGKSTVAQMFKRLGAKVIDADKIAHKLIAKDGSATKVVIREFGKEILKDDQIDRKKLAKVVFKNSRKLKQLTDIIHPKVRREIKLKIEEYKRSKRTKVIIIEVPLLFESKFNQLCDVTIAVKATRLQQVKRAQQQLSITKAEALRRIVAQFSLRKKVRLSDMAIDNSKSKQITKKQVKEIWQKQLQKLKK